MDSETRSQSPAARLLRLWLWTAPLALLALSGLFGALAIDEKKWGLLAAMVLLGLTAVGLWLAQRRLMKGPTNQYGGS